MKNRSFFVAGALLLASLFTTSCKEFMSNLDEPVSSYLSVSDTSVVLNLDTVYQIKANSINSDKAITYKSSDESIATVDANGLVTPVGNKEGDVVVTVSVAASEYYKAGEQKVKIAVKQPLTFEALEDGSIRLLFYYVALDKPVVVTKNRTDKKEYTNPEGNYQYFDIDVKKGDKLQFESANDRTAIGAWNYLRIAPRSNCAVYGNVMSMIAPDGKYHTNKTITKDYALARLLYGYRHLVTDHNEYYTVLHEKYDLMVPATKLTNSCYYYMLANTGITKTPKLPATEIPNNSYQYMFTMCGELTEAPAINVKSLGQYACANMFYDCPKLKKANAITVEKAAGNSALASMFSNCPKLTESPAITAESLGEYACQNMFNSCGLLEKAKGITVKKAANQYAFKQMFANCTKLTESPAITAESLGEYACQNMFDNSQKLEKVNAINVKTVGQNAFYEMFANQPVLKTVVAINAEKVYNYACYRMFYNCIKLETGPSELKAKELAQGCYMGMFQGCTSLTKAPDLLAEKLADYCYIDMFSGCTKLNSVKCLAKDITTATWPTWNWLNEVAAEGTFTRAADVAWSYGPAGIPAGWTVNPPLE